MERDTVARLIGVGLAITAAPTEVSADNNTPLNYIQNRDIDTNREYTQSEIQKIRGDFDGQVVVVEVAEAPISPTEVPEATESAENSEVRLFSLRTYEFAPEMLAEIDSNSLTREQIENLYTQYGYEFPVNFDRNITFMKGDIRVGEDAVIEPIVDVVNINGTIAWTAEYPVTGAIDADAAPDGSRVILYETSEGAFGTTIFKDNDGLEDNESLGVIGLPALIGGVEGVAIVPARFIKDEAGVPQIATIVIEDENGVPQEVSGERLDELGITVFDARYIVNEVNSSTENMANFQDALNLLPQQTYITENGVARAISVNPENYRFNQRGELAVYSEDGTEMLVWNERAGWVMPQFETRTARILLDYDFTQHTEETDHYANQNEVLRQNYVFRIRPGVQGDIENFERYNDYYMFDISNPSIRTWLLGTRGLSETDAPIDGSIPNNPLVENPYDGTQSIDALLYTSFAMMYFDTATPTTEQLQEIRTAHENGEELIVNVSRERQWVLGKTDIIFSPFPSHLDQWGSVGVYGKEPISFDEEGRMTIHVSNPGLNNFAFSFVAGAITNELSILGAHPGIGIPDNDGTYTILYQTTYPVSDRYMILPLVVAEGQANTGGHLEEKPTPNSELIPSS